MVDMKKKNIFLRYFISILLVIYMLAAACMPATALLVEGERHEPSQLPSFRLTYEDGALSLRLNAELLYEVVADKNITREEIKTFLPEEIRDLFEDGKTPSPEELRSVLMNYLTNDEIRAMVEDLPIDLIKQLVDVKAVMDLLQVDELMQLVNVETLLEDVDPKALLSLVEGEPLELMLTDAVMEKILDDPVRGSQSCTTGDL